MKVRAGFHNVIVSETLGHQYRYSQQHQLYRLESEARKIQPAPCTVDSYSQSGNQSQNQQNYSCSEKFGAVFADMLCRNPEHYYHCSNAQPDKLKLFQRCAVGIPSGHAVAQ